MHNSVDIVEKTRLFRTTSERVAFAPERRDAVGFQQEMDAVCGNRGKDDFGRSEFQ